MMNKYFKDWFKSQADFETLCYNPTQAAFSDAPYFGEGFINPTKLWFMINNQFAWRLMRYGLDEFIGYFNNNLVEGLEEHWLKQLVWLDTKLSDISDQTKRGRIRASVISNTFNTASTPSVFSDTATAIDPTDYVADKRRDDNTTNMSDNDFNIVTNLRELFRTKFNSSWDAFLGRFEPLFMVYEGIPASDILVYPIAGPQGPQGATGPQGTGKKFINQTQDQVYNGVTLGDIVWMDSATSGYYADDFFGYCNYKDDTKATFWGVGTQGATESTYGLLFGTALKDGIGEVSFSLTTAKSNGNYIDFNSLVVYGKLISTTVSNNNLIQDSTGGLVSPLSKGHASNDWATAKPFLPFADIAYTMEATTGASLGQTFQFSVYENDGGFLPRQPLTIRYSWIANESNYGQVPQIVISGDSVEVANFKQSFEVGIMANPSDPTRSLIGLSLLSNIQEAQFTIWSIAPSISNSDPKEWQSSLLYIPLAKSSNYTPIAPQTLEYRIYDKIYYNISQDITEREWTTADDKKNFFCALEIDGGTAYFEGKIKVVDSATITAYTCSVDSDNDTPNTLTEYTLPVNNPTNKLNNTTINVFKKTFSLGTPSTTSAILVEKQPFIEFWLEE